MSENIKRGWGLALAFLLLSVPSYAGELEGFGEALFTMFIIILAFILIVCFLIFIFRKNAGFILFTIANIALFFVLAGAFAGGETPEALFYFAVLQLAAQIIAIFKAIADSYNK